MRIALGMFVLGFVYVGSVHADDRARAGKAAVFTVSNEAEGNRVLAFKVRHDGTLGPANAFATGGKGSGDSLGSQGALVLSHDQRFLIAVDAGSDELSVFEVHAAQLKLRDRVASGGKRPISVTERCGLVYVVHAGSDDVMGFHLDDSGKLTAIEGSHRRLSGAEAGPAQISLSPDARTLIVTEKQRNVITTYDVDAYGKLSEPMVNESKGMTPFGFELTSRGVLVVSEAATASMSSYALGDNQLAAIISAVPDHQQAPCWVEITADDRVAFTANAGSSSISSYDISSSGALTCATSVRLSSGKVAHFSISRSRVTAATCTCSIAAMRASPASSFSVAERWRWSTAQRTSCPSLPPVSPPTSWLQRAGLPRSALRGWAFS